MASGKALLLVDVQNDFLPPAGSLAVADGDKILPVIMKLLDDPDQFDLIVATLVRPCPGLITQDLLRRVHSVSLGL